MTVTSHNKFSKRFFTQLRLFGIVAALLNSSCVTEFVSDRPAPVESSTAEPADAQRTSQQSLPSTVSGQLDPELSAQDYIDKAQSANSPFRETYYLHAAEKFLQNGQVSDARKILETLDLSRVPEFHRARRDLLLARSSQLNGNHNAALGILRDLTEKRQMAPEFLSRAWSYRAESEFALELSQEALQSLQTRAGLLSSEEEQADHNQQLWGVLSYMSTPELNNALNATSDPTMRGWIELARASREFRNQPEQLNAALRQWRGRYPEHPGLESTQSGQQGQTLAGGPVRQIGLLLPLSSYHGSAAQAFYDGFSAAHDADSSSGKPQVVLYDVGGQTDLTPSYYQAAVQENADFIVGPLGKRAVDSLVQTTELEVPILLLGVPGHEFDLPTSVFQFGLQPEQEAVQVADRAYANGHRFAGVLYPLSEWGQRMLDAFQQRWESLGGILLESQIYYEEDLDHSATVREFLRIQSILSSNSSANKKNFTPKPRQDLDFVFLPAKTKHARLIKPQFDYFLAHELPIYATSHVYGGREDPINDVDLEGIIFSDMPWMLDNTGTFIHLRQFVQRDWNGKHSPLDRLYALGMDAYALVPQLGYLRQNPVARYSGVTASLRVEPNGKVARENQWAQFRDGVPVLLDVEIDEQSALQSSAE